MRTFIFRILFFCLNANILLANAQDLLIENKGQLQSGVMFYKTTTQGTQFYHSNGYTVYMRNQLTYDSIWHDFHLHKKLSKVYHLQQHAFQVFFLNSLPTDIEKKYPSSAYKNFFIGRDKSKWANNVHSFAEINYNRIYNGITFQVQNIGNNLKHNYIIQPNANPDDIRLLYKYIPKIYIINGNLIITTSVGEVIEQKPYAFQIAGTDTIEVPCVYQLKKDGDRAIVSFKLGSYDRSKLLIIDPVLVFSTYSGSQGDNFGFTATYDSRANMYSAGIVDGDEGSFPVTFGAFQTTYGGGAGSKPANLPCDIGINKYDSAGLNLLFSTYLGGEYDDYPHSLVVDNNDNLLVLGTTYSRNFPMDSLGYDTSFNGATDIYIAKLSKNGSTLLGATFMGGSSFDGLNSRSLRYNYSDDYRGDIVVDSANNIYVASTTYSNNFPIKSAFQSTKGSYQEGCVFSLSPLLQTLRFSTFVGGNDDDACYSVRMFDSFLYVGGGTASNAMNFPINGAKNTYGGKRDGFIIKLYKHDGALVNSSYFGTPEYDQVYFIDIDQNGQVYAAGQTEGIISRTPGTYGKDRTSQFVVRFSPNLANVNMSTTFGYRLQNPEISPSAFLVDECDNIYFSGWGSPIAYNGLHPLTTQFLPVSPNAIQSSTDSHDFYLMV